MKKEIIETAVECLKRDGLKFSLDMLAEKMKISKKTIYKYFPCKEVLAREIYEAYYDELDKRLAGLFTEDEFSLAERSTELLSIYFEAVRINRDEIFNKFSLNDVIRAYAFGRQNEIWAAVSPLWEKTLGKEEATAFRIILEGTFEKLLREKSGEDKVFSLLRKLI